MVADCVTAQRLLMPPAGPESRIGYGVGFGLSAEPAPLRAKAGGSSGLLLDIRQSFQIVHVEQWSAVPVRQAVSTAYEYRILDMRGQEILVFHWHPQSVARGPVVPHLHVSASLLAQTSATLSQRLPLDKRHVPTGSVTHAGVVRMLIAEFGIAERRRDWPTRLARADLIVRRSFVVDADV